MTEIERMYSGRLYNPYKVQHPQWLSAKQKMDCFNASPYPIEDSAMNILRDVFANLGERSLIIPPVFYDHGWTISIGKHFFANTGLTVLDIAPVVIGDNVFIGPHVSIYTAEHPIDAEVRNADLEYAEPVNIGNNVWIGGNVVINPGVTIGSDTVIGSGSVVTKDIPDHCIAVGNPCRVVRDITDADREYWKKKYQDYLNDPDTPV